MGRVNRNVKGMRSGVVSYNSRMSIEMAIKSICRGKRLDGNKFWNLSRLHVDPFPRSCKLPRQQSHSQSEHFIIVLKVLFSRIH